MLWLRCVDGEEMRGVHSQGGIADARRSGGEQLAERCGKHDHVERHGDGSGGYKGREED